MFSLIMDLGILIAATTLTITFRDPGYLALCFLMLLTGSYSSKEK